MAIPRDKDARIYYRVAKLRLDEADTILSKADIPAAAMYIAGFAVECVLKALLLTQTPAGKRVEMLRSLKADFGHDLRSLYDGVKRGGAKPLPNVSQALSYVSTWSSEDRYKPVPGNVDDAQRFIRSARSIVDWADGKM